MRPSTQQSCPHLGAHATTDLRVLNKGSPLALQGWHQGIAQPAKAARRYDDQALLLGAYQQEQQATSKSSKEVRRPGPAARRLLLDL